MTTADYKKDKPLTTKQKQLLTKAVKRIVKQYGEVLRRLAKS